MEAFPPEDHASGLHNLDFNKGPVPMQRSLGVYWYLKSDSFTFQVLLEEKPFTPHTPVSGTTLYLQKRRQYGKNGVILFELWTISRFPALTEQRR